VEVGGGGEGGGEDDDGGAGADRVGASNCERPDTCSTRRCMLRPPVTPLPDETAAAIPALASPLAAVGFEVESVAPASGTNVPVDMLETGAFVTGACVATAVPPVDRRFGIVDGACETGAVLSADPADGAVMVACLGRLVNLRWSERASG
jgi:hypothetical protein